MPAFAKVLLQILDIVINFLTDIGASLMSRITIESGTEDQFDHCAIQRLLKEKPYVCCPFMVSSKSTDKSLNVKLHQSTVN